MNTTNRLLLTAIIIFLVVSCGSKTIESKSGKTNDQIPQTWEPFKELSGTKWSFEVAEGYFNTYHFTSDTTYKYYSVEVEDTFYGTYKISMDTLYLEQYMSAGDSLLPKNSSHISQDEISKWIMYQGKLKLIEQNLEFGDKWEKIDIPPNILYKRDSR